MQNLKKTSEKREGIGKNRQANKKFVSFASHQLLGPLTNISISAEILFQALAEKLSKEEKTYLKNICLCTKEMVKIIDGFLIAKRKKKTFKKPREN